MRFFQQYEALRAEIATAEADGDDVAAATLRADMAQFDEHLAARVEKIKGRLAASKTKDHVAPETNADHAARETSVGGALDFLKQLTSKITLANTPMNEIPTLGAAQPLILTEDLRR